MDKTELLNLLRDNLTIRLDTKRDYGGEGFEIVVEFDGEKICSDYLFTKTWQD